MMSRCLGAVRGLDCGGRGRYTAKGQMSVRGRGPGRRFPSANAGSPKGGASVPQKKSTVKRLRQTKRITARRKAEKSGVATAMKKADTAPPEDREQAVRHAVSTIDKAAKTGAIKKRTAARRKSRVMRRAGNSES